MPARKIKRIVSANITYLSLVPRGATHIGVLYKDDSGSLEVQGLAKSGGEGKLIAAVYVPGLLDVHDDFASDTKVIEEMAHSFMRNGAKLDVLHNQQTLAKTAGFVAESFIIQKGDERFKDLKTLEGAPIDATGGWGAVIKIDDPTLQSLYENNKWTGVSMFGPAIVQYVEKSDPEETQMTPEQLAEVLKANRTETVALIKAEIEKALPKPAEEKTVVVKYDPTKPESLEAALAEINRQRFVELSKNVDFTNPEEVKKFTEALGKKPEQPTDLQTQIKKMSEQLEVLSKAASKQMKKSDQPINDPPAGGGNTNANGNYDPENMTPEQLANVGRLIGQAVNRQGGYLVPAIKQ